MRLHLPETAYNPYINTICEVMREADLEMHTIHLDYLQSHRNIIVATNSIGDAVILPRIR